MIRLPWSWASKKSDDVSAAYLAGFDAGFQKAWDLKLPWLHQGLAEAKRQIRDESLTEALAQLEPLIRERLQKAALVRLQPGNALLAKQRALEIQLSRSKTDAERNMTQACLDLLRWAQNGHLLQTDQSPPR